MLLRIDVVFSIADRSLSPWQWQGHTRNRPSLSRGISIFAPQRPHSTIITMITKPPQRMIWGGHSTLLQIIPLSCRDQNIPLIHRYRIPMQWRTRSRKPNAVKITAQAHKPSWNSVIILLLVWHFFQRLSAERAEFHLVFCGRACVQYK